MKTILFLFFVSNIVYANCEYNSNLSEGFEKSREALQLKGYQFTTKKEANYELNTEVQMISYDQNEGTKFISYDVVGNSFFKAKNVEYQNLIVSDIGSNRSFVDANYYRVKIIKAIKLEESLEKAKNQALQRLDEKLAFKIEEYLKACQ
jgi:hypothetical protein